MVIHLVRSKEPSILYNCNKSWTTQVTATGDEDCDFEFKANLFGRIQEFQPDSELISAYTERLQLYFEANDVASAKQVPVLLSVIGVKTYSLLRSLLAPELPQSKTLSELLAILKNHFEP